jgi:hypothetical protein
MQATAPGRSVVLQAGQRAGVDPVAAGAVAGAGLLSGRFLWPAAAGAAAAANSGARFLATANSFRQAGQRTCLPAALSGIRRVLLQRGHRMTWAMSINLFTDDSSLAEQEHAAANPNRVAGMQLRGLGDAPIVEVGSAFAADIC